MTLDLIKLLSDIYRVLHAVVDVAGLDALGWEKRVVLIKCFDYMIDKLAQDHLGT